MYQKKTKTRTGDMTSLVKELATKSSDQRSILRTHGRRREPTPQKDPLTSTCVLYHVYPPRNKFKKLKRKILKDPRVQSISVPGSLALLPYWRICLWSQFLVLTLRMHKFGHLFFAFPFPHVFSRAATVCLGDAVAARWSSVAVIVSTPSFTDNF